MLPIPAIPSAPTEAPSAPQEPAGSSSEQGSPPSEDGSGLSLALLKRGLEENPTSVPSGSGAGASGEPASAAPAFRQEVPLGRLLRSRTRSRHL